MKKTLSLLAVILVLVFAVSCGSSKKEENEPVNDEDTIDDTDVVDDRFAAIGADHLIAHL